MRPTEDSQREKTLDFCERRPEGLLSTDETGPKRTMVSGRPSLSSVAAPSSGWLFSADTADRDASGEQRALVPRWSRTLVPSVASVLCLDAARVFCDEAIEADGVDFGYALVAEFSSHHESSESAFVARWSRWLRDFSEGAVVAREIRERPGNCVRGLDALVDLEVDGSASV